MTKQEGNGVLIIMQLADAAMKRLPRDEARSLVDGLADDELAALGIAHSLAQVATGGTGNLVLESMAARLTGVDVEAFSSKPTGNNSLRTACGATWHGEGSCLHRCVRPKGHPDGCAIYCMEGDYAQGSH